jgi:YesN/AraC family two-component response regulator
MKKVLLVDDNVMMRRLIINLFKEHNIEFHEASDGHEGLEKIAGTTYDLVITDIIMPGMEGIEMIMMARKQFPGLKIIAMSGSKPYYLYLAKKLGVEAVFTKPLNHNQFYYTIEGILNFKKEYINQLPLA